MRTLRHSLAGFGRAVNTALRPDQHQQLDQNMFIESCRLLYDGVREVGYVLIL